MPYNSLTATIGQTLFSASLNPGLALQSGTLTTTSPSAPDFGFGTTLGLINLIGLASGTATAAPVSLDLSALLDPIGTSKNWARVAAILICNNTPIDGHFLLLDGTVSNAWKAPFNGIATAKLLIPSGYTHPIDGKVRPGLLLLSGGNSTSLAVSGTSKVISLDPGANTIPYSVYAVGRDV